MTTNQVIISLIGIAAPSATALLIAYWHREQMRQNELFRVDPTVGLVPSPSRFWAFVKSYWLLLLIIAFPILGVSMVIWVIQNRPIRGWEVFLIAWQVGNLVYGLIQYQLMRINQLIGRIVENAHSDALNLQRVVEATNRQTPQ